MCGFSHFILFFLKNKNAENKVIKVDVTEIYEKEFGHCKNENAYCTPYTLLRLLADLIPEIPDKILYLDSDITIVGDISELYNTDTDKMISACHDTEMIRCIFAEKYKPAFWTDYLHNKLELKN